MGKSESLAAVILAEAGQEAKASSQQQSVSFQGG